MSQSELLKRTVDVLNRLGIPFMLTGSLASSYQGEPRATHDVDLVVDISTDRAEKLMNEFPPPNFYLSGDAIKRAIEQRGMFNLVETSSGDKVDFWMLTTDPFDQSRFQRRQRVDFEGMTLSISRPEDTILMKLKWARDAGGSEKQFRDARRVFELQRAVLDLDYVEHWIDRLQLRESWQRLLAEAEPLD